MVEVACKTLATQRLKRSGMSWRDGKQAISPFVVSNRATDGLQLGRFPLHTSALESLRSVSTVTCENWSWPRRLPSTAWRKKETLLCKTFLAYPDSIRSDHPA